jgi:hypothetical protein
MAEKKYKYPSEKWIKATKEEPTKNKECAEVAKDRSIATLFQRVLSSWLH